MAVVLLAVLVVFVGIPLIRAAVMDSDSDPAGVERALGASNELSAHDESVIADLGSHVQRFNAAALPLITDYTDPTVSALRWVRSAGRHIEEMQEAASAMEVDILSIEDDRTRCVRKSRQSSNCALPWRISTSRASEQRSDVSGLPPKSAANRLWSCSINSGHSWTQKPSVKSCRAQPIRAPN